MFSPLTNHDKPCIFAFLLDYGNYVHVNTHVRATEKFCKPKRDCFMTTQKNIATMIPCQIYSQKRYLSFSTCFTHSQDTAVRFSSIIQRKVQLTAKRHWNENHTHRPPPWGGNEWGSVGLGSWIPLRISACPTTLGQAKWVGLQD